MAQVLQGIPGVVYFIDDILVTGHTRLKHEANLRRVLDRIREYGLRLKKSKCLFFQKELEFLGHLISKDGVKPTKSCMVHVELIFLEYNKYITIVCFMYRHPFSQHDSSALLFLK